MMENKHYYAKAFVVVDNYNKELVVFATDKDSYERAFDDLRNDYHFAYGSDDNFDNSYTEDTIYLSESEIAGLQAQI